MDEPEFNGDVDSVVGFGLVGGSLVLGFWVVDLVGASGTHWPGFDVVEADSVDPLAEGVLGGLAHSG